MNLLALLRHAAPRVFAIRKRTWIAIGAGLLVLLGLLAWAAVALMSWLWGQAPTLAEAGRRAAGTAMGQVEQVVPGVKEQVAVWLPGVAQDQAAARDVSGPDIGPMARYPGLVRDYYTRKGSSVEVHYSGRADFQAVLEYYARGFAAAGYRQEVITASREAESHRYALGDDLIEFKLTVKPRGHVQVELKEPL